MLFIKVQCRRRGEQVQRVMDQSEANVEDSCKFKKIKKLIIN